MSLNGPVAGTGGAEPQKLFSLEGLPLRQRPEWTDVVLDRNGYRATIFMLGKGILVSRPVGYVTVEAVRNATALPAKIVELTKQLEAANERIRELEGFGHSPSTGRSASHEGV